MKISDKKDFFNKWQEIIHQAEAVLSTAYQENSEADFIRNSDNLIEMIQTFKSDMTEKTVPEKSHALINGDEKRL
ncbi:MAG: hypothetical protein M0P12_11605 [Paludibacteraceae bacterium]|nr:hypothetical protein [Paludibacteraceae bacterium]